MQLSSHSVFCVSLGAEYGVKETRAVPLFRLTLPPSYIPNPNGSPSRLKLRYRRYPCDGHVNSTTPRYISASSMSMSEIDSFGSIVISSGRSTCPGVGSSSMADWQSGRWASVNHQWTRHDLALVRECDSVVAPSFPKAYAGCRW